MADLAIYFCSFRDDLGIYVRLKREADWWYEKDAFKFPAKRGKRFYTPDFKVLNTDNSIEY